nr:S8 family serine peptidase [Rufibacter sp. LB8]
MAGLTNATFVKETQPITGYFQPTQTTASLDLEFLAKAVDQLQPQALFDAQLTGKGVKIGVLDAGFYEAPGKPGLAPLFAGNHVKAHRDFVNPTNQHFYTLRESLLDNHGTKVLERIGGYDSTRKALTGLATGADYYLARTDHGGRENRLEEEKFVQALEWLDSLGVKLVNSSLGYATGFDDPMENYKPTQMDGSSFIARAVQLAIEKKGMLIVVSAGNEGAIKSWQVIGTPADAAGTIAVGATDYDHWTRQGYSGMGPAFLPYLKPDLACFATDGTSFSAPIITGLTACLLQANPSLTGVQLADILRKSGHLYPFGNNYVGYGVPNAGKALALALAPDKISEEKAPLQVTGTKFTFTLEKPLPAGSGGIVLFRKKSATLVISQQKLSGNTKKINLKRLPGETHTTVQMGDQVVEVVWQ